MMNSLSILPTPQFVSARKGEGEPVAQGLRGFFFDGKADTISFPLHHSFTL